MENFILNSNVVVHLFFILDFFVIKWCNSLFRFLFYLFLYSFVASGSGCLLQMLILGYPESGYTGR